MRRRSFTSRPSPWRHRFVQIAREAGAASLPPGSVGFGLRARPAPLAAASARAPGFAGA